jgi:hypothetical protein
LRAPQLPAAETADAKNRYEENNVHCWCNLMPLAERCRLP